MVFENRIGFCGIIVRWDFRLCKLILEMFKLLMIIFLDFDLRNWNSVKVSDDLLVLVCLIILICLLFLMLNEMFLSIGGKLLVYVMIRFLILNFLDVG